MAVVMVVVGGACIVVAGVAVLRRLAFPRWAFAPAAVLLVGMLLIALGIAGWHTHGAGPKPVASPKAAAGPMALAGPSPARSDKTVVAPLVPVPSDDGRCAFKPGTVHANRLSSIGINAGLPASGPADVQHLPTQLDPGPPAGAALIRSAAYPFNNPGYDAQTAIAIAPMLTDMNTADYDDLSLTGTGGLPFMQLAIGTPKPGTCWNALAYTAITSYLGPGHVANAGVVQTGQRMSANRLTMVCADMIDGPGSCAWAGPGTDGRHPLFGILRISPGMSTIKREISAKIMATYVENVFDALTA